jgi:hypothetical protein
MNNYRPGRQVTVVLDFSLQPKPLGAVRILLGKSFVAIAAAVQKTTAKSKYSFGIATADEPP